MEYLSAHVPTKSPSNLTQSLRSHIHSLGILAQLFKIPPVSTKNSNGLSVKIEMVFGWAEWFQLIKQSTNQPIKQTQTSTQSSIGGRQVGHGLRRKQVMEYYKKYYLFPENDSSAVPAAV